MIVEIGLIVGCYVTTRMLELLTKPASERHVVTMVAGVLTLGVTVLMTASLFVRAAQP